MRAINLGSKRIAVVTKNSGRIFRSSFGISPLVAHLVWNLIDFDLRKIIFWFLLFMKVYSTESTNMLMLSDPPTEKTFRKWVWEKIAVLEDTFRMNIR